jgi:hypothetical protein
MASVYLDASFVSACVSSREDTRSLYRKETSLEWMETQASRHALFVSPEVLLELSSPEFRHRVEAARLVADVPSLVIADEVLSVACSVHLILPRTKAANA